MKWSQILADWKPCGEIHVYPLCCGCLCVYQFRHEYRVTHGSQALLRAVSLPPASSLAPACLISHIQAKLARSQTYPVLARVHHAWHFTGSDQGIRYNIQWKRVTECVQDSTRISPSIPFMILDTHECAHTRTDRSTHTHTTILVTLQAKTFLLHSFLSPPYRRDVLCQNKKNVL